jgi:hypothetical protein
MSYAASAIQLMVVCNDMASNSGSELAIILSHEK